MGTTHVDDTDIDFDHVPLPGKYAHGFRIHFSGPLPVGPTDPQACRRYDNANDLREKGFAYLVYGRYAQAIFTLNQSRALWPDCAATYRWLAEAYTAAGQPDAAIANYRLLFYGWPGKYVPTGNQTKSKAIPSDKPSDYAQPNPEETDPVLLLQFSLLLQQADQYAEARAIYERGMRFLSQEHGNNSAPLPPTEASSLPTQVALEAATRIALASRELVHL